MSKYLVSQIARMTSELDLYKNEMKMKQDAEDKELINSAKSLLKKLISDLKKHKEYRIVLKHRCDSSYEYDDVFLWQGRHDDVSEDIYSIEENIIRTKEILKKLTK